MQYNDLLYTFLQKLIHKWEPLLPTEGTSLPHWLSSHGSTSQRPLERFERCSCLLSFPKKKKKIALPRDLLSGQRPNFVTNFLMSLVTDYQIKVIFLTQVQSTGKATSYCMTHNLKNMPWCERYWSNQFPVQEFLIKVLHMHICK
jgi:hypothetical protein